MFDFFTRFLGSKSQRTLAQLKYRLDKIHQIEKTLRPLSLDQLRGYVEKLKENIHRPLTSFKEEIDQLEKQVGLMPGKEKRMAYAAIQKMKANYYKQLKVSLDKHLEEAFAVMRETAYRFSQAKELRLTATPYDRLLSTKHAHVKIKEKDAIWQTTWEAGGQPVTWKMVHYDVQLLGGMVLHKGAIAEMATGEGKTLAATLPVFLHALGGMPVHVITVNDYLSKRDAEWMGPLYQFYGLTVDCIDLYQPQSKERRRAYRANITFGTNSAFGFDYLRDNMVHNLSEKVQNGLFYGVLDEGDSVLIDDARTPLIISGPTDYDDTSVYVEYKPSIEKLYHLQASMMKALYDGIQKQLKKGAVDSVGKELYTIYRGMPKYQPFIELLSEKGMRRLLSETEAIYIADNNERLPEIDDTLYFTIDSKNNTIELTEKGVEELSNEKKSGFFSLPDLATQIAHIERDPALSNEEKKEKKEAAQKAYALHSSHIHAITQLLKAYALFQRNIDYVVMGQKVLLVDEKTGRIQKGRRYSHGLHQAIEAKENVRVGKPSQTYATITPQNYFLMYETLSGMTGTAEREATEFWNVYKMDVVSIPTNRPVIRTDHVDKLYRTKEEKYAAIKEEVAALNRSKRPVLIGTSTVEQSEEVRKRIGLRNDQVLNAKNHKFESRIVANAGKAGSITIVTHMAGRGTDILLDAESVAAGGLAVIGTERHSNRSVDLQLRGRAGRQGDPGSSQFYACLEDDLLIHYKHGLIGGQMDKAFTEYGEVIQDRLIASSINNAQKNKEQEDFESRKRSLDFYNVIDVQRGSIYTKRDQILDPSQRILLIEDALYSVCNTIYPLNAKDVNPSQIAFLIKEHIGIEETVDPLLYFKTDRSVHVQKLYEKSLAHYHEQRRLYQTKINHFLHHVAPQKPEITLAVRLKDRSIPVSLDLARARTKENYAIEQVEKEILLYILDEAWKEHLRQMEELKNLSSHAVYEQKDPLIVYKYEALDLFKELLIQINKHVAQALCIYLQEVLPGDEALAQMEEIIRALKEQKEARADSNQLETKTDNLPTGIERQPIIQTHRYQRNDRVTVVYKDGRRKEHVKFKTIEQDLLAGKCDISSTEQSRSK